MSETKFEDLTISNDFMFKEVMKSNKGLCKRLVGSIMQQDIEDIVFDLAKYENTWGQNNPEALLYIHDLNITRNDYQIMGKNQDTLKITKFGISYMKFHAKELIEELEKMDEIKINLIGKPNVNEWMGRQTPQIFIEAYELEDNKYGF